MKKLFSLVGLLGVALVLSYCSPKVTKSDASAEAKVAFDAKTSVYSKQNVAENFKAEQLASGKALFETKCVKCHKLFAPETNTVANWNPILDDMIPKTHVNDEEASLIRAYAIANAK